MKKTLLKSIGTLLLAVLTVCLCWGPILGSSTAAVNIINVYENFPQSDKSANTSGTGSYSIYWEYWSQGASKYSVMKSGGSFLVAEAKLLLDSGVVPPGYIDPDKYYEWGKTNNYFKNNISIANTDYLKLLVNYAKQFHVDVTYEIVSLSGKTQKYSAALVQSAINDGYYVVLFNSKKAVYVGYSLSRKYEKPILLDSKADYSYAAEQVQTYVGSEYKGDAEFTAFVKFNVALEDENVTSFNKTKRYSDIGYYCLKTGQDKYVSIHETPDISAYIKDFIIPGKVFNVVETGNNYSFMTWYKISYLVKERNDGVIKSKKIGYANPHTAIGFPRFEKITDPFIFEVMDPNIINSSYRNTEWIAATVYNNIGSSAKVTKYGCIIYVKSGSGYKLVAHADVSASSMPDEICFNHSFKNNSDSNFIDASGKRYKFEPETTYYYRYYIEYTDNNKTYKAYSKNLIDMSDYNSFVNPPDYGNIMYGDANGDGKISTMDSVLIVKHIMNEEIPVKPGADVNGDGKVTTLDHVLIVKYIMSRDESTGESPIVLGPQKG